MIDIYDLYQDFEAAYNTFQGGFFPPQSVFLRAVNNINQDLWIRWTREAEKSQEAKDNLFPFLKSENVICQQQPSYYSVVAPPKDYGRLSTANILVTKDNKTVPKKEVNGGKCCNGEFKQDEDLSKDYYDNVSEKTVEIIDNKRWASCLEHLTKNPTFDKPKMTQINNGFKVAPREVSVIVLNYYKLPEDATFAYTTVGGNLATGSGGQIIYNKAASNPLLWNTSMKPEFLIELGVRFSLYTREQFIFATTQKK